MSDDLDDTRLPDHWWGPAVARHERSDGPAVRPRWVGTVERAVGAVGAPDGTRPEQSADQHADQTADQTADQGAGWGETLAVPLWPFVRRATIELRSAAVAAADAVDVAAVADHFAGRLGRDLLRIAAHTMVAEVNARRPVGADDGAWIPGAVDALAAPAGFTGLLTGYPVLARMLAETAELAVDAMVELLGRFVADRAAIVRALLGGTDPGPLVAVATGAGDRHRGGRSVAMLSFADGRTVVYKPRDSRAGELLSLLQRWLNDRVPELGLMPVALVVRDGYGWMEFVECAPLAGPERAEWFYHRQGALLALLYATSAADMHCENVIACGEYPVIVDAETLFHPALPLPKTVPDPAADALARSVYRTSLLPSASVGQDGMWDLSGLGGDRAAGTATAPAAGEPACGDGLRLAVRSTTLAPGRNRPWCDGAVIDPIDFHAALLAGFRAGYTAITRDRAGFADLLRAHDGIGTRIVFRSTQGYARLFDDSTRPEALRSADARDATLGRLRETAGHGTVWSHLVDAELVDLWRGDIPIMHSRPGTFVV